MTRELWAVGLSFLLVACNGSEDDTGTDDTGDTDVETGDTGDTDTGEPDPCGNGTVDSGEQCDEGVDNGPDGSCSDTCTFNGWVTCDLVTGPVVTLDTSALLSDGRYHAEGRFTGKVELDASCTTDTEYNVVVQIEIPADGSYLLSTDHIGTTSEGTAISLRTDCDDRAELACTNDNTPVAGFSQAWIDGATAGDDYVAIIELVDGEPLGWHLTMTPIDGVANVSESCDFDTPCADGASCTDGTCVADAAPTITSVTVTQTEVNNATVVVEGTDPNRDVTTLRIPGATNDAGATWGDSPNEVPWIVSGTHIQWDGDDFTITYQQGKTLSAWSPALLVTLDYDVVDLAGNVSGVGAATLPTFESNVEQQNPGEACDLCNDVYGSTGNCGNTNSGFPRYCEPNTPRMHCTFTETVGEMECALRENNVAPVITSASMSWDGLTALLEVAGSDDAPGRLFGTVTYTFDDTTTATTTVNWTGSTSNIVWSADGTYVGGPQPFTTTATEGKTVTKVEIALKDNASSYQLTSTPFEFTWVAPPTPSVVGAGEECDGVVVTCDTGLLCGPDLSGAEFCVVAEAPVLYSAAGVSENGALYADIDVYDGNADWQQINVQASNSARVDSVPVYNSNGSTNWSPAPAGIRGYVGRALLVSRSPFWMYKMSVEDSSGLVSEPHIISSLNTDIPLGSSCELPGLSCNPLGCQVVPPDSGSYCDVAAGATCSGDPSVESGLTCKLGTAPVLTSAVVRRLSDRDIKIDIVGSDVDFDATYVGFVLTEDGETTTPSWNLDSTTPLNGVDSFAVTTASNTRLTTGKELATSTVAITVYDNAFLASSTLTVNVPPLLGENDACSTDDSVNKCATGLGCLSGTCQADAPTVDTATLAWTDMGRDAVIHIEGNDDTKDITKYEVAFNGPLNDYPAALTYSGNISANAVVYSGGDFIYEATRNDIGFGELTGSDMMRVTITDVLNATGTETFEIPLQLGYADECDLSGEDDRCYAGTFCDIVDDQDTAAITGLCDNDPTDPCLSGKTPIVVTLDSDIAVDWAGHSSDIFDDNSSALCATTNTLSFNEVPFVYEATEDGTLTVTTTDDGSDTTVQYAYITVRGDTCAGKLTLEQCADGKTGTGNTLQVPVFAGDVKFIHVESSLSSTTTPASVRFSFTPAAVE